MMPETKGVPLEQMQHKLGIELEADAPAGKTVHMH
jgi:hypothetical protein